MIMRLVWLMFAHFIGDIALQSEWIALNKGKYWICMVWHSMIWTAIICLVLEYFDLVTLWKIAFLFIGHYGCDLWKCRTTDKFPSWHLYADQGWHLVQVILVGIL